MRFLYLERYRGAALERYTVVSLERYMGVALERYTVVAQGRYNVRPCVTAPPGSRKRVWGGGTLGPLRTYHRSGPPVPGGESSPRWAETLLLVPRGVDMCLGLRLCCLCPITFSICRGPETLLLVAMQIV